MGKIKSDGGMFETFDSGAGPTVPEESRGDFAHQDSADGLSGYTQNPVDDTQGSNPEVPSKQR